MLTFPNNNAILLGDKREVDFLLSKIRVQSRLEKSNHFSLIAEMHPFCLELNMPKGYKTDGNFAGRIFQKGIHPLTEFKKGMIPWNKTGRTKYKKVCLTCYKEYKTIKKIQKYCSRNCIPYLLRPLIKDQKERVCTICKIK